MQKCGLDELVRLYRQRWNPETGERSPYDLPYDANGFEISLQPLESVLLVTGGKGESVPKSAQSSITVQPFIIATPWTVTFVAVNSEETFERIYPSLLDFTKSEDSKVRTFAGTAVYSTKFNAELTKFTHLSLGQDNDFISEVELNGKKLGVIWYGSRPLELRDTLRKGENELIIRYTTTLWNAMGKDKLQPSGLVGPVMLR